MDTVLAIHPAGGCLPDTSLARPAGPGVPYETGPGKKLNQHWQEKKWALAPLPLHTQTESHDVGAFERAGRKQGDMRKVPHIEDPRCLELDGRVLQDAIRPELCAMCSDVFVGNVPEGKGEYYEPDPHHPSQERAK
jgi:hypothetical protein